MSTQETTEAPPKRIVCMDQLRGYAIFGMLIVNARSLFFTPMASSMADTRMQGFFDACLFQISHHRSTFTYADTIAPLFVFVVGMGMRVSWLRRSTHVEPSAIRKAMAKRYGLLVLIAFALYAGWLWDALMDIGLAGLLAVLLIDKKPPVRILAAFAFVAVYQCLFSWTSYGTWLTQGAFDPANPDYLPLLVRLVPMNDVLFDVRLNGGPLGPLSWAMMLFFGAHAYDLMASANQKRFIAACLGWGFGLCALGYALHVEWPGIKTEWSLSAYRMAAPFPLWASGLCFLQLLAFYVICDLLRITIPTFTSVGMNPLVIYIAQSLILGVAEAFEPERLSLVAGFAGFALFWGIFAGWAYYMHRKRIYIKL